MLGFGWMGSNTPKRAKKPHLPRAGAESAAVSCPLERREAESNRKQSGNWFEYMFDCFFKVIVYHQKLIFQVDTDLNCGD